MKEPMRSVAHDLTRLDPFDEDDVLRMVVETPRGASVKLTYDPDLGTFTVTRAASPIPSTGDLFQERLPKVDVTQKGEQGREDNPRLILMPTWHDRLGEFEKASGLPGRLKQEIEQFFVSATFFTGKNVRVEGWRGPKAATKLIKSARRSS
jgi:inorganic pyrophosphatase